jgi:alpha-galactosidase
MELKLNPMISVSGDKTFALTNRFFSYVFRVSPEGMLEHIHYGSPVDEPLKLGSYHLRTQRHAVSNFQGKRFFNLSDTPQEYPSFGTSDYGFPAVHGRSSDGNTIFSLQYRDHKIVQKKPRLKKLPSARGGSSETLIVTLVDPLHRLEVDISYTIYADYGVLARSAVFRNNGDQEIGLQHAFSSALDLPADDYEILHLHGTWGREFNEERIDVPNGRFVVDSARGTSSAAHNPFIALIQKGTTEDYGRVYGTTLVYSGNFAFSVEKGEFADVRVLAGINPFNFHWRLKPGKKLCTPEALHVFADKGLRSMSRIWHDFIRDKISPKRFRHVARPTYLNTWEAAYFDVDEIKVLGLADEAKELGVDMLVLDDGWFEGRRDDTTSLGDWTADKARFPSGIPALAAKVKAKGLKFGIWFEPEMVNPASQLFKDHPEWTLHVPGRTPSLGRNQLTLDLSRDDVVDYLFEKIDAVLSCGDIDYVKWDMNRNMTEVGSGGLSKNRQQEVSHRYMLGLYKLLKKLTRRYPDILFENCASGGNRFDLGMLSYMPQGWISDMCDPIGRLEIINGASYLYPLDTMAAYIGPSPNHQNGRVTTVETRFNAGVFCAARGISLNETDIAKHKPELQKYMKFAKATGADMVGGQFDRLRKDANEVCWQYICRDNKHVYLAYFHILSGPNLPFRRVRMVNLDPTLDYVLLEDGKRHRGDALMSGGMAMPYVSTSVVSDDIRYMPPGDFASYLFVFKSEKPN